MSQFRGQLSALFKEYLAKNRFPKTVVNIKRLSLKDAGRNAAVLCCLDSRTDHLDDISVLMNIRSSRLSRSPGDACFPGGMVQDTDASIIETALRETNEEINLMEENIDIISTLPPVLMGFSEIINCNTVISTLKNDSKLCLQPNEEVDRIFWVPLKIFLGEDGNHWQVTAKYRRNLPITVDYFKIQHDHIVWGLTARLCVMIASIVYSRPPNFPFNHYYISSVDNNCISVADYCL